MIGLREIIIFTVGTTAAFLAVALTGYYYFCRWHNQEKSESRQHVEAHVAEVLREGKHHEP